VPEEPAEPVPDVPELPSEPVPEVPELPAEPVPESPAVPALLEAVPGSPVPPDPTVSLVPEPPAPELLLPSASALPTPKVESTTATNAIFLHAIVSLPRLAPRRLGRDRTAQSRTLPPDPRDRQSCALGRP
jgi:hypothetical protein